MRPASSPGPRQLPSGAVAIGPWTVSARAGRVYLSCDPNADADLATGPALDLAAAIHDAATAAERAAVELAELVDLDPAKLAELARRPVEVIA